MSQSQEGYEYERKAYKALGKYNLVTGGTAGASHDRPDITLQVGREKAGVELKITPTAAGSLVMQYFDGKWHFGPTENNTEKEFLESMGNRVKILDLMNKQWKHPVLQYRGSSKIYVGAKTVQEAYQLDIAKFGARGTNDIRVTVSNKVISDYYNSKNCEYLNVGTKGLFLLNREDPLDLNSKLLKIKQPIIPNFSDLRSAKTEIRVRCQYKSSVGYQFAFTFQFKAMMESPFNIAPLKSGSRSDVDTRRLQTDSIIAVLTKKT